MSNVVSYVAHLCMPFIWWCRTIHVIARHQLACLVCFWIRRPNSNMSLKHTVACKIHDGLESERDRKRKKFNLDFIIDDLT